MKGRAAVTGTTRMITFNVSYLGAEHSVTFAQGAAACEVERAVCVACAVPWGSVLQLLDEARVVQAIDSKIVHGAKLQLQVVATAAPIALSTTVKTINVVEPVSGLPPECKFVLVGDGGVGKTSYLACLRGRPLSDGEGGSAVANQTTSGCEISGVTLQTNRGPVGCKFWDVGGVPESAGVCDAYYSSAHAAVIFFNFGHLESYWNVLKWQNEVHRVCGDIPIAVVGCGADLRGFQSGPMASTPAIRVCCLSGAGALHPILTLLRRITSDADLAFMHDPCLQLPKYGGWNAIVDHVCGTLPGSGS